MKLLFDLFPLLAFFIAYARKDIYWASGVLVVACSMQIAWLLIRRKPIEKIYWISFIIAVIAGSLTVVLHDVRFLMWKPTIAGVATAAAFWLSTRLGSRKPLMQHMLGTGIQMPDRQWRSMNNLMAWFSIFTAALNLAVAFTCSEKVWVRFKVFGLLGLTLVFMVCLLMAFSKHITPVEQPGEKPPPA